MVSQISGLIIKRFHRTRRNKKGLVAEIVLPIIFVLLAMLATKLAPNESEPPPLVLHPWYWGRPNFVFQSLPTENVSTLSQLAKQTFIQSPSLGTRCMPSTTLNRKLYPCEKLANSRVSAATSSADMDALNKVDYNRTRISPECDCWEKMQTCPRASGGPGTSFDVIETKDVLQDLQGFNITDW